MKQARRWRYVPRHGRTPLYVQVRTRPSLAGCWSVNLSPEGIGLIATSPQPPEEPREAGPIEVEFALPDGSPSMRLKGEVRWRHDAAPSEDGQVVISLGVRFIDLPAEAKVSLGRYLHGPALHVAVALATPADRRVVDEALAETAQIHAVDSAAELKAVLARGDISSVLLCGESEEAALALAGLVAKGPADARQAGVLPSDLAAQVIWCAPARPARLVELFNAGTVFRAVPRPLAHDALVSAVLAAGREHGMRTEQRRMGLALERALEREREKLVPESEGESSVTADGASSAAMRRVHALIRTVARHRVPVLLQGETGVGKEVLARTLHSLSDRAQAPFVVQDCGVLTQTLLESELFGHVRGAFTDAVADKRGLFVLADGGTIFLDEIENTTPEMQAKLLRVIETGDVRPVGGTQVRRVDVRVIAASNRDLAAEVRGGRFRADLYYRLAAFPIEVPPLRERPDDVLPLARHFLQRFNASLARRATGFTQEAEAALLSADWPGNVRELRNAVERAVLLSSAAKPIGADLLPEAVTRRSGRKGAGRLREQLARVEREIIREALERHGGVLRRAAIDLGEDPVTLARRAKKHGVWNGRT